MTELSHSHAERSRKIETNILNALSDISQVEAAKRMGVSEGTVSKLKGSELTNLSKLIAALDLKVVPTKYKCLDPAKAQAMMTLYDAAMRRIEDHTELLWGDE